MTLHFYFARKFLAAFAAILGAFFLLNVMIDMVDHLRRFDSAEVGFAEAFGLALLRTPESLYGILPLLTVLATIALFLNLARSSELVVTRASGRSALRSVAAPAIAAMLIGALGVAAVNPIVAATAKRYAVLEARYESGAERVLSIGREGLWLRQGGPQGQTVIHAAAANRDGTRLADVSFFGFDPAGAAIYRIRAESAALLPGAWQLGPGKRWSFGTDAANPERAAERFDTLRLSSDLTATQIRDSFGAPATIAVWDLPGFIAQLEQAGFSATPHRVFLQVELAMPLLLAAVVLVAAGFTMRHARFERTGMMGLFALLAGIALFFLRNFAQVLGENGQIPALVAAWTPPLAGLLLALGLLLHLEDG